jgi:hypothetical protein
MIEPFPYPLAQRLEDYRELCGQSELGSLLEEAAAAAKLAAEALRRIELRPELHGLSTLVVFGRDICEAHEGGKDMDALLAFVALRDDALAALSRSPDGRQPHKPAA